MSQETQKYKLKEYNFSTDSTQDFVNGVAGIGGNGSKSNMQIIEDEIDRVDNKVVVDGVAQSNFNFHFNRNGNCIDTLTTTDIITAIPKLYKISKSSPETMVEIQYSEVRDLVNYTYKFM